MLCIKSSLEECYRHKSSDKDGSTLQHLLSTRIHHGQSDVEKAHHENIYESGDRKDIQRSFRQERFGVKLIRLSFSVQFDGM